LAFVAGMIKTSDQAELTQLNAKLSVSNCKEHDLTQFIYTEKSSQH